MMDDGWASKTVRSREGRRSEEDKRKRRTETERFRNAVKR